MPDYSKGKIYTIRCHSDDSLIYVGATTQSLAQRLCGHKTPRSGSSISKYIANEEHNTSWDDWHIELYEVFPCENKMELEKREKEVIREIATINRCGYYDDRKYHDKNYYEKNKAMLLAKNKEYNEKNKDVINAYRKEYYERNKDVVSAYKKNYYEQNKDVVLDYHREHYEKNKEVIRAKQKEYYERKKKQN